MKIGMMLENAFPPDLRVENEAAALCAGGHEVHVLAPAFSGEPLEEERGGVRIHRFRRSRRAFKRLQATVLRLPLYKRFWMNRMRDLHGRTGFDALHVHDLPLAAAGISLSREFGIPCILDLHENFPALLEDSGNTRGLVKGYFFNSGAWRRYESWAVRNADRIIVVVDEALVRLKTAGADPQRITVVSNTPDLERFRPDRRQKKGPLRMIYAGGFGPHRGIETVLQAMPELLRRHPGLELVLAGDGAGRSSCERLAAVLGIERYVKFLGWIESGAVADWMGKSDIGLVPHASTGHTNSTVPHKLFQYMAMAMPVLVSDCAPLQRIVASCRCGAVFHAGDPLDFVRAFFALGSAGRRRELGMRGRRAVEKRWTWRKDAQKLTTLYRDLGKSKRTGRIS
ncbi:glycosyltransferase family 4 protein [bacterium]|nr:glycosyltransferase family 4 protein [bacterium]